MEGRDDYLKGAPLVHVVVYFVILFGVGLLPAPAPITTYGMRTLGVFFALIYGWCAIGMIWPSLAGMLAMGMLGLMPLEEVFRFGFGHSITLLLFFMMMVAKNLEQTGISKLVAMWFISRPWILGKPWLLSLMLLLALMLVSSVTSAAAVILLGWIVMNDIMIATRMPKFAPYANFMMIGVVLACAMGDNLFTFRTVGAVSFAIMEQTTQLAVSPLAFTLFVTGLSVVILACFVLMGKYIFRIPTDEIKGLRAEYFADMDFTMDRTQKMIAALMLLLVVLMLAPSVLPEESAAASVLNELGSAGVAGLVTLLMCVLQVDGRQLMAPAQAIKEGVSFEVIFLTAAILPLALSVISSKKAGINAFIVNLLEPLGQWQSPVAFMLLVAAIALVLTNLINNMTVPAILFPALYPIAARLSISPVALMVVIVFCCGLAVMLPSATPMAAMMYGNTAAIRKGGIYRYVGAFLAVSVVIIFAAMPLALKIFG
ncbi:MAG: SLC13 family permease [Peptococcaceae bacterium]|nr:SLC13 family permease [Peptococcaceae bacterium]